MSEKSVRELTLAFFSREEFAQEWEKNISKGGVFLQADPPPGERERVKVIIEITDTDTSFELPGEAVHVSPQGVGVQLDTISGEVKSAIEKILAADEPSADTGEEKPGDDVQKSAFFRIQKMSRHEKLILAKKGAMDERAILMRDRDPNILHYVLQNPRITISEIIQISKSQSLSVDLIKHITRQTDWMAVEEVRLNIILNPKTPQPTAINLLRRLSDRNIRMLAKRPIKQAIKSAALKIVIDKGGR